MLILVQKQKYFGKRHLIQKNHTKNILCDVHYKSLGNTMENLSQPLDALHKHKTSTFKYIFTLGLFLYLAAIRPQFVIT